VYPIKHELFRNKKIKNCHQKKEALASYQHNYSKIGPLCKRDPERMRENQEHIDDKLEGGRDKREKKRKNKTRRNVRTIQLKQHQRHILHQHLHHLNNQHYKE
jgi:hypothetical protein